MSYIKAEQTVKSFNGSFPLPRDRYLVSCVEEDFAPSKSSGQPMITRIWEVVGIAAIVNEISDTLVVDGSEVNLAGIKLKPQYLPLRNADASKAKKAVGRFLDEQGKLGLDNQGVDIENPFSMENTKAIGKFAWALISCERSIAMKEQTPEQKAQGLPGDEIKDSYGKSIIRYTPKLDQILTATEYTMI